LRPKSSHKLMIFRRVAKLREKVKVDTQRMRVKWMKSLEEIFNLAVSLAKGEFKTQTVNGETVKVTMKQRQMWARIAAYTAQIMNSIAQGFDERQIDVQLNELERLVSEAKAKAETKGTEREASRAKAKDDSSGPR